MFDKSESAPPKGYKLPLWELTGYRATAIAYMCREKVSFVENVNGKIYSLAELKQALVKFN